MAGKPGELPKQFWGLIPEQSMIVETALRGSGPGFTSPIVVCNVEHRFLVAEQLCDGGMPTPQIILEPVGRNSAPSVAAAALLVAQTDPQAVIWMMASDSAITDVAKLHRILDTTVAGARAGRIVTLACSRARHKSAIVIWKLARRWPTHPASLRSPGSSRSRMAAAAKSLVASGALWNAGMFVFTAEMMLEELQLHAPEALAAVRRAIEGAVHDLDFIRLQPEAFTASPNISLDCAVAEHTSWIAVVPADLGWSDVGSWDALWELGENDETGNVAVGDVLLKGSHHCYVRPYVAAATTNFGLYF